MVHILLSAGYETVAELGEADVILVNTCGFIRTEAMRQKLERPSQIEPEALDTVYAADETGEDPELEAAAALVASRYRKKLEGPGWPVTPRPRGGHLRALMNKVRGFAYPSGSCVRP